MSCSFQTQSTAVLSLTLKLWKGGKILKARTGKDLRKVAAISRLKSPWQQWSQELFLPRWTYQGLWMMIPEGSWHSKSAETARGRRQSRVKNRPERRDGQAVYHGQCYLVVSTAMWSTEICKKIGTERPLSHWGSDEVPDTQEGQTPLGLWLKKSAASRNNYKEQKVSLVSSWPVQENCSIIKNG